MGRTRRRRRAGKGGKGAGTLSSLRGGFRSVAQGVTGGKSPARPASRGQRIAGNVITVVLLLLAVGLLLRKLGVFNR